MMEGQITYPPGVPVSPECKDLIQRESEAAERTPAWTPRQRKASSGAAGWGLQAAAGRPRCVGLRAQAGGRPRPWPVQTPQRSLARPTPSTAAPLAAGMLNPNPERRAGLDDIFQHAWLLKDLPPGALGMNDW